jgi:hypothetical protein
VGFYIRKGFNFGALRLNLSRSGLGMSVGVKGARIGVGPRGSYIHLGRGGLYYRQSLGRVTPTASPSQPITPPASRVQSEPVLSEIESGDARSMVDAHSSSILAELNRVQRRLQMLPVALVVGVPLLVFTCTIATTRVAAVAAIVFLAVAVLARHQDVTHGTAVLNYFLDLNAQHNFEMLSKSFELLVGCAAAWHINASARTEDWKHQAGADTLLKRSRISPCISKPRRVVSNLAVPMLDGGRQKLYFFPDRLLIYEPRAVGAVTYDTLEAVAVQARFVENGRAPGDAEVVDHTWQYVNKRGGPDRRFANNPQHDIALYSTLVLASESGLRHAFHFSKSTAANSFVDALSHLKKLNLR